MQSALGASFIPSDDNAAESQQAAASEPISQAIKILALRLPRVLGASSMSPGALVQPHIGAYNGPDPIVQAAIEKALGGASGGTTQGQSTTPTAPPQITPGEDGTNNPTVTGGGGGYGGFGGGTSPHPNWGDWSGRYRG